MTSLEDWPDAPLLRGDRIVLEPLREDHAVEMAPLLGDAALHIFIGGEPLTSAQLMSAWLRSQGVTTLVAHIHPRPRRLAGRRTVNRSGADDDPARRRGSLARMTYSAVTY